MHTGKTETTTRWNGTFHFLAPTAPPKICGVGDHSFHLAAALSAKGRLLVHCGQSAPAPLFGDCGMVVDFDQAHPRTLGNVADSPLILPGETLFAQYTNFAYGRYGFNPWLAPALARLRRRGVRVVTMFHETYMPASEGWKAAVMGWWQKRFFRQVGRNSDVCLFSTEPWARRYAPWFPGRPVECLPVGSNIRVVAADREAERARLGLDRDVPCLVVFGGTHPSRLFDWIAQASRSLSDGNIRHAILHVGPDADAVARLLEGTPLLELGILPEEMVSRALTAGDVLLAPISDGASTRRGSLLAGLEHGLCCITTRGPGTDELLSAQEGSSLLFARDKPDFARIVREAASDPAGTRRMGGNAKAFYRANFSWDSIADRLLDIVARG